MFPYEIFLYFFPISVNNHARSLKGIVLTLWVIFSRTAIFALLILPIYEHGMSFHLPVPSSGSSVLKTTPEVGDFFRFIPRYSTSVFLRLQ